MTTDSQPPTQPSEDPTSVERRRLKWLAAATVAYAILGPPLFGLLIYQSGPASPADRPSWVPSWLWDDEPTTQWWDAYYQGMSGVLSVITIGVLIILLWKKVSAYFGVPNMFSADEREQAILQQSMLPAFVAVLVMLAFGSIVLRIDYCRWMSIVANGIWIGNTIRWSRRELATSDD